MERFVQVGILGSTQHNVFSRKLCVMIGELLASYPDTRVITNGCHGIAETVSAAFYEKASYVRCEFHTRSNVIHISPFHQMLEDEYSTTGGVWLHCGRTLAERQEIFAKSMNFAIMIEGGPGAYNDAVLVQMQKTEDNNVFVIPIPSTSPYNHDFFELHSDDTIKKFWSEVPSHTFVEAYSPPDDILDAIIVYIKKCINYYNQTNQNKVNTNQYCMQGGVDKGDHDDDCECDWEDDNGPEEKGE